MQIAYWILKQRLITLRSQRKAVDTKVHVLLYRKHEMHVCVCLSLYFHSEKKNTLLDLVRNGTDNFFGSNSD